jgi:hypothetical protein
MKQRRLFLASVVVFTTLLGATTNLAFAATNYQSVNVSYKTYGSGHGISSGKRNGIWHHFASKRKVTLKINSRSGSGIGKVTLYRNKAFLDSEYGTVRASVGSHTFGTKTNIDSGQYYLIFFGGNANTTQRIRGAIHD